jgi:predicted  nucleic acid-binding Zn-ribbon protein
MDSEPTYATLLRQLDDKVLELQDKNKQLEQANNQLRTDNNRLYDRLDELLEDYTAMSRTVAQNKDQLDVAYGRITNAYMEIGRLKGKLEHVLGTE